MKYLHHIQRAIEGIQISPSQTSPIMAKHIQALKFFI